jgi:hypothetical protein
MSTWKAKFEKKQQDQKDAEMAKKVEINDISFPSLSTESAWGGGGGGAGKAKELPKKNFAQLAAEWKTADELQTFRQKEEMERQEQERKNYESGSGTIGSRFYNNFGTTRSRMEDTYYEDEYAEDYVPPPTADTSDDWRAVERKVRRAPKSAMDRAMAEGVGGQQGEVMEERAFWHEPSEQEESVWGKY